MELKSHYSISELLQMQLTGLPTTKMGMNHLVKRQLWAFREIPAKGGRGGIKKVYAPPPEIMQQIQEHRAQQILAEQTNLLPSLQTSTDKENLAGSTEKQRTQLGAREAVLNAIDDLMLETKVGKEAAITTFLTSAQHPTQEHLLKMLMCATDKRGGGQKVPNMRTIKRWFKQREENRLMAKIPQKNWHEPDWYQRFLRFYRSAQKPSTSSAYQWWIEHELVQCPTAPLPSIHQVRRWLEKTGEVERNKGRMLSKELKNIQPFIRRNWQNLAPLDVVCADGHCFDAECTHPDNENVCIRPEITTIVDVGTRKIVGVGVDLAESGRVVRSAIVMMLKRYGIANVFYADNGKGYTNGLLNDEYTGLFWRVGMTMLHSAPYSSQSNGVAERSHKSVLIKAAKRLQTYIGKDMDDEAARMVHKITRKAMKQGPRPKQKRPASECRHLARRRNCNTNTKVCKCNIANYVVKIVIPYWLEQFRA